MRLLLPGFLRTKLSAKDLKHKVARHIRYSKNFLNLKKQVAKFRCTVYTKIRSKCLPLADGAGYK